MKKNLKTLSLGILSAAVLSSIGCGNDSNPNNTANALDLQGTISTSQTLNNHTSGVDYIVRSCVTVSGSGVVLTVAPGTTIAFESGACLTMTDGGALNAVGTAADGITFTGLEQIKGYWLGIRYYSNSGNNRLTYCTVEYAGSETGSNNEDKAAIGVGRAFENAGRLALLNTTVRHNQNAGISIYDDSEVTQMDNCTFTDNNVPVHCYELNLDMPDNDNTYTGNTNNYIEVEARSYNTPAVTKTLAVTTVPYKVSGSLYITNTYNINAGVNLLMSSGGDISLAGSGNGSNGILNINGTSANPVTIEGVENTRGYWNGILVDYGGTLNMNYCNLSDGASYSSSGSTMATRGMIFATNSTFGGIYSNVSVRNSVLSNCQYNGISIPTGTTYNADIATSNTFNSMGSGYTSVNIW